MTKRIDALAIAPAAYHAMLGVEGYVQKSGIEKPTLNLIKLRASYMNGCAYCVDMHSKEARAAGETEQRIYSVAVWRETPYYTPSERAALEWCEAVTTLGPHGVPDAAFAAVSEYFAEVEIVVLTMAVVSINGWNRLAVALGADVGSFQVGQSDSLTV